MILLILETLLNNSPFRRGVLLSVETPLDYIDPVVLTGTITGPISQAVGIALVTLLSASKNYKPFTDPSLLTQ